MPFIPLPKNFLNFINCLQGQQICAVDLGCADGRLGTLIAEQGVHCIGLDRMHPVAGTTAAIVGDALQVPLLSGTVDLVVVGNLTRHLLAVEPHGSFLEKWVNLLSPNGRLYIFEDEPSVDTIAMRNYKDLQEFLAVLAAGKRTPLLSVSDFYSIIERSGNPDHWEFGVEINGYSADVSQVLKMLNGNNKIDPKSEIGLLVESISKNGLNYGNYWWAMFPGEGV